MLLLMLPPGEGTPRAILKVRLLRLSPLHGLAADDNAAPGKLGLLADLGHHVPLAAVRSAQRRRDELCADTCF